MSTVPQKTREGIELILPTDRTQVFPTRWRRYPEIVSLNPKIVFLGDSVLDDSFWLQDPTRPLRRVLKDKLKDDEMLRDYEVLNFAVDRMESYHLLKRTPMDRSWETFETARRTSAKGKEDVNPMDATYNYLEAEDGNIYSIENLRSLRQVKCVVVSIGGNDALREAGNLMKLAGSIIPYFKTWRHLFASDFNQRLRYLLQEIQKAAPEALIVPVIFYHPHNELLPIVGPVLRWPIKTFLHDVMTPMARSYLFVAQALQLPVIDLSQTFNPENIRHYSTMDKRIHGARFWSGVEPSDVSQVFIADLIQHVLHNWDASQGSMVYYAETQGDDLLRIQSVKNTQEYAESYIFGQGMHVTPQQPQAATTTPTVGTDTNIAATAPITTRTDTNTTTTVPTTTSTATNTDLTTAPSLGTDTNIATIAAPSLTTDTNMDLTPEIDETSIFARHPPQPQPLVQQQLHSLVVPQLQHPVMEQKLIEPTPEKTPFQQEVTPLRRSPSQPPIDESMVERKLPTLESIGVAKPANQPAAAAFDQRKALPAEQQPWVEPQTEGSRAY